MSFRSLSMASWLALCLVFLAAPQNYAADEAKPDSAAADKPLALWPDGAPGAAGQEDQDRPELRAYLAPEKGRTGTAVVVCPGGGYGALATDHEGTQVARWFNTIGVTAFVLKYRLAPRYRHPAPLQDAQRALRYVRSHAKEYGLAPGRIGIMGFSAGGHLASTAATHFDAGKKDAKDAVDRASCRPDFVILGYPVISMTEPFGHTGSRNNLLGSNPDPQLALELSNEKQVTAETPTAFLFHTGEDTGVPAENSLAFYAALRRAKVPAELHIYQSGPHGVGLAPGDPSLSGWKDRLADWLKYSGLLADVTRATVQGTVMLNGKPLRWGQITFLPEGDERQPAAFGMISQGKFSIAVPRGPVLGTNRVEIRNLGSVEPRPTIKDVQVFPPGLVVDIVPEKNDLDFDLKGEDTP